MDLEVEVKRHLYLPRAADGVLGYAENGLAGVEGVSRRCALLALGWRRRDLRVTACYGWRVVVGGILRQVVARHIETGGVGDVVDVEGVLQRIPLANADGL